MVAETEELHSGVATMVQRCDISQGLLWHWRPTKCAPRSALRDAAVFLSSKIIGVTSWLQPTARLLPSGRDCAAGRYLRLCRQRFRSGTVAGYTGDAYLSRRCSMPTATASGRPRTGAPRSRVAVCRNAKPFACEGDRHRREVGRDGAGCVASTMPPSRITAQSMWSSTSIEHTTPAFPTSSALAPTCAPSATMDAVPPNNDFELSCRGRDATT